MNTKLTKVVAMASLAAFLTVGIGANVAQAKDYHFKMGENRMGENHMGKNHMVENRMGENHMSENRMGENHMGENRMGENRMGENHMGENRMGENHMGENHRMEMNDDGTVDRSAHPCFKPNQMKHSEQQQHSESTNG